MTSLPLLSRRGIGTKSRKFYLRRLLCCISSLFTLCTSHAVRRPCSPSNRELPNPWICAELQQSTTFRKVGALLVDLYYVTQPRAAPGGRMSRPTLSSPCTLLFLGAASRLRISIPLNARPAPRAVENSNSTDVVTFSQFSSHFGDNPVRFPIQWKRSSFGKTEGEKWTVKEHTVAHEDASLGNESQPVSTCCGRFRMLGATDN
ncbi:hypothetical protein FA13DRAFT_1078622 [Coprinellus micaceus]|uniref:Uncharacterized protein n=1 Tax=Coprinellus micaceus TaxID=71717 RepID=A0A4Y7TSX5_COPMI|nr:hypothetical protein FA13DRAFT_1078622 [Coprinellus micaceus]